MFDDKFVWGVASSAYQVEGTDSAGRYRRINEKGGWLNEEVADWFGEYAKVVFMHRDFQRRRATGR